MFSIVWIINVAVTNQSRTIISLFCDCAQHAITEKTYYYWLRKLRTAAAEAMGPQLVRLDENSASPARMIHIRYGTAELRLPEDVDMKALAVFLNALRRHD